MPGSVSLVCRHLNALQLDSELITSIERVTRTFSCQQSYRTFGASPSCVQHGFINLSGQRWAAERKSRMNLRADALPCHASGYNASAASLEKGSHAGKRLPGRGFS